MRRKSRNRAGVRKERLIMLASSIFVLAALTLTGVYIRGRSENENDGYVVDFSTLENRGSGLENQEKSVENRESVAGTNQEAMEGSYGGMGSLVERELDGRGTESAATQDDLDYDPNFQEADSANVENSQFVAEAGQAAGDEGMFDEGIDTAKAAADAAPEELEAMEDAQAIATSVQPSLNFGEKDSLVWPVVGNVLINYSMDKTVYFPTLEQYKYSPAIVIEAPEGEAITAAANGRVQEVFHDPEIGNAVRMELGNGYELTYGQLENITVSEGGYVEAGDVIGNVAAPTKYYSLEGSNVYFKLTKDGAPVNPMTKLE